MDDGSSVYESSYILEYLELKYPQVPLLPQDIDERLAARKLEVLCDGVCDAVVLTLFERMRAGGGSPEWIARQRRKIEGGVAEMAKMVGARPFAVGGRFGLGDIALGTAVGYLSVRFQDLPWRTFYPDMALLSDRLEARPSFKSSVPYAQTITDKVM